MHYHGVEDRIAEGATPRRDERARLRPARDTGMSIERRRAREERRAAAIRRNRLALAATVLVALLLVGTGWRWSSDIRAASSPLTERSASKTQPVLRAATPAEQPTPIFASYRGLKLHSPISVAVLTEVGFHQASFSYALPMKSPMPDADTDAAKANKGTDRDASLQKTGEGAVLTGEVLRMWRDRPGKPDTAADIGAPAGSPVVSPVNGTVVLVKKYKLYGKHPDVQIHIVPDGHNDIDIVLIHIAEPAVKAGDRVMAGLSPLGRVRKLSDRINMQLGDYSGDPGDHVHLQINDVKDPAYEGLDGAIELSGS